MTGSSMWQFLVASSFALAVCWESPLVLFPTYAIPLAIRGGIRRIRPLAVLGAVGLVAQAVWGLAVWAIPSDPRWVNTLLSGYWGLPSLAYGIVLLRITGSRQLLAAAIVAGGLCMIYVLSFDLWESQRGRMSIYGGPAWPPFHWTLNMALWHGPVAFAMWRWSGRARGALVVHPECSGCGYALTGLTNPAACPECGAQFGVVGNKGEAL